MSTDDYETPKYIYDPLNDEFHFNDDPCPLHGSGGLDRDWGQSVFCNPPYSNPAPWIKKAFNEWRKGKTIVMLLRCDPSTNAFHDYILGNAEIRYIRGRIKFNGKSAPPFASWIIVFRSHEEL